MGCKTHNQAYTKALALIPGRCGDYYYKLEDLRSVLIQSVIWGEPLVIVYEAVYVARKPKIIDTYDKSDLFTSPFEVNDDYARAIRLK